MNSCFEFKNTCSVCAGTGVNEPSSTAGDGYNIISNIQEFIMDVLIQSYYGKKLLLRFYQKPITNKCIW